jgi:hypothetical protein
MENEEFQIELRRIKKRYVFLLVVDIAVPIIAIIYSVFNWPNCTMVEFLSCLIPFVLIGWVICLVLNLINERIEQ